MALITINQIQPDGIYTPEVVAVLLDKQVAAVRKIRGLVPRQVNARSYKYLGSDIIAYWHGIFGDRAKPRTFRRKQDDHQTAMNAVAKL